MEFRILGPVEVHAAGVPLRLGGRRELIVLATLVLSAGRNVSVDDLVDALWDEPPATARRQIAICVSSLRRHLRESATTAEPDPIRTRAGGYLLQVEPRQVDAIVFEQTVTSARECAAAGRTAEAADLFRTALALWRGPALAGIGGRNARAAAIRLEEQRLTALEERAGLDLALGRHAALLGELAALVEAHPFRERLRAHLMLALYRTGRQADALAEYRKARAASVDELGIEPGEELRRLEQAILNGDPMLDLGTGDGETTPPAEHRVPEPVGPPGLLPADIGDFIGRQPQVDEITALLRPSDDADRAMVVVTISGKGGVGKTTLAVHAAHRLREEFPDGQLYVDLDGAESPLAPADVLLRFLRALDVPGDTIGASLAERAEQFRNRLAGRRVLVVLDNALDSGQVGPLLPGSPSCAVLITSRSRMAGMAGARTVEIDVFDADAALGLVERIVGADRVAAEPEAARRLVRACAGLPLALRIAAAKLAGRPHWTVERLADRLADERRRLDELTHEELAVRASVGLSYRALPDTARALFRRLGTVDAPDAASWVGAAILQTSLADAEDLLDQLVDARLLDAAQPPDSDPSAGVRYSFHDLIRAYARERAEAEDSDAERVETVARTAGAYLALAGHAVKAGFTGDQIVISGNAPRWPVETADARRIVRDGSGWFETERAGLMGVLRQADQFGLDALCWELSIHAYPFFQVRTYHDDWQRAQDLGLAAARRCGDRRGEAAALCSGGLILLSRERYPEALTAMEPALEIFTELGEARGEGMVLSHMAVLERAAGHYDVAQQRCERGLAALAPFQEYGSVAYMLRTLGQIHLERGENDLARARLEEALQSALRSTNSRLQGQVLYRLGELDLAEGQWDDGAARFRLVLDIVRSIGDTRGETYARLGLGRAMLGRGDLDHAGPLLQDALRLAQRGGEPVIDAQVRIALGELHAAKGRPAWALAYLKRAVEVSRAHGSRLYLAKALQGLGSARAETGDTAGAQRDWDEAADLFAELGSRIPEPRSPEPEPVPRP